MTVKIEWVKFIAFKTMSIKKLIFFVGKNVMCLNLLFYLTKDGCLTSSVLIFHNSQNHLDHFFAELYFMSYIRLKWGVAQRLHGR